jgi:hypothetical protein
MGLFGKSMEVELALDAPYATAGAPVLARLRLGEPDDKVQGGRVDLLYRNYFKHDTTDSDGDRVTRTTMREVPVATVPMAQDGVIRAGELRLALAVPPDAPGSALHSVDWLLRAVVDRRRGADATAETPVHVRAPATPLLSWAQAPVLYAPPCPMTIDLSARVLRPGDRVSGTLTVTPTTTVDARSLRVQLRRVRQDQDGNTDEDTPVEVTVSGPTQLAPGGGRSYPFELTVPPDAPPSFAAAWNAQHWLVEGVVDLPRAVDHRASLEVVVQTA